MSELLISLNRVESLIIQGELDGALTVLWMAMDHAKSAEQLLAAQTKSMTDLHLRIKELNSRDNTLDNLRAQGLEDHLTWSDSDA